MDPTNDEPGDFRFEAWNDFTFSIWTNNDQIGIRVDNNSDVGIGTTDPQAKLDVNGNIKASGDICIKDKCLTEQQFEAASEMFSSTVADYESGLIWQVESSDTTMNWEDAVNYCDTLILANQNDWRLPVVDEYDDQVASTCSVCSSLFPEENSMYWTSSENHPAYAGFVNYSTGTVGTITKALNLNVRCVR